MPHYEKPNPVMDAIQGYKAVDDIFRQKRADKQNEEDRAYNRDRQTRMDNLAIEEQQARINERKKQDDIDKLNAVKYYIAQTPPGQDPLTYMPKEFSEEFQKYLDNDPATQRYFTDPKFRSEQQTGLRDIEEGMAAAAQGAPDMPKLINGVNTVYADEISKGLADDGRPAKKKVLNKVMLSPDGKSFSGTVQVTRQDGTVYEAPLTEGRDSNPDAPIKWIPIQDISAQTKMRQGLIDYVQARLIERGDKETMKEIQAATKAKKVGTAIGGIQPEGENSKEQLKVIKALTDAEIDPATAVGIAKLVKPDKEEGLDFKDYGHGKIMYTKGPKKGQIEDVPVKPEKPTRDPLETLMRKESLDKKKADRKAIDSAGKEWKSKENMALRYFTRKTNPTAAPELTLDLGTGYNQAVYDSIRAQANEARRVYEGATFEFKDEHGERYAPLTKVAPKQAVGKPQTSAPKPQTNYGQRADGSPKGNGFLGPLKRPDGKVSTEISVGVNLNGKEMEIPTMVPTLDKSEIDYLLNMKMESGGLRTPMGERIMRKAVAHARKRIAEGKSPFAAPDEAPKQASKTTKQPGSPKTAADYLSKF